jgi:secreted PhoX family phosphatase
MLTRTPFATVLALIALALPVLAVSTKFSTFTPLTSSAGAAADPTKPITLSNPNFSQRSIADRTNQNLLVPGSNSGDWDMIATNETGPNAGRFLFMPFETDTAGVQRVDLNDPHYDTRTVTIVPPGTLGFVSGDASRWTPWGGYLTAEESWEDDGSSTKGRLFEVTNPVTAGPNGGDFVWRMIIPRVSHEGLAFDRDNNLYFVDERFHGAVYKYVSANPDAADGATFFAEGQTFALKVGAGGQTENPGDAPITGAATWVPITNAGGGPLAGVSVVLSDGTIDGRQSADDDDVNSSEYNRPEDVELKTLSNGRQLLYFATTDSDSNTNSGDGRGRVYTINLSTNVVSLFASAASTDLATGAAVAGGFRNPDNIAIDAEGNIYIIEDRPGAGDDDIWFARDINQDGDITDLGEGLGRWASNGTPGSEFTGLYFDIKNPNRAYVNIQHPTDGNDRLIEIRGSPSNGT